MMCGRMSGHVRDGRFHRMPQAPPLRNRNGHRSCGYCGGNVYLEPDDGSGFAVTPAVAAAITQFPQRRAS